jgi:lipopolysaccharide transport system permease protein
MTKPVNPHAVHLFSPLALINSLYLNRQLILQMIKREVMGRYKGSMIGFTWSFFTPILMLIVYTVVFSKIFKMRWGDSAVDNQQLQFAIVLFVGMIVLTFFTEILNRSPSLIISNANYVKKVVFPLEVLPAVIVGSALFHALISSFVLVLVFIMINHFLYWTVIFLPLVLFPLIIFCLGVAWLFSAMGVFVRDTGQAVSILSTLFMFISPVFYPISAVPPELRVLILANPLTFILEELRAVLIFGQMPNWLGLTVYLCFAILFAWIGYVVFQKTRKGFADVI